MIQFLEFASAALAIIGNRYIKKKKWIGFVFWTISNISWCSYAIMTKQWFMMMMYIIFTYYTVTSIHTWRNGKNEEDVKDRKEKNVGLT